MFNKEEEIIGSHTAWTETLFHSKRNLFFCLSLFLCVLRCIFVTKGAGLCEWSIYGLLCGKRQTLFCVACQHHVPLQKLLPVDYSRTVNKGYSVCTLHLLVSLFTYMDFGLLLSTLSCGCIFYLFCTAESSEKHKKCPCVLFTVLQ